MKKKLLLPALLFSFACFAQTFPTFTSNPMTDFTIASAASPIDQTPTGSNATWTFTNLTAVGTNIDTYAAPTAGELSTYPGTTEVLSITTQGATPAVGNFFLKVDGSGTSITGVSQGDIILNYNSDNAFIGLFPLNFGANNSDPVAGTFSYQGTNGTFVGTITTTVDAFGVLNIINPSSADYNGNVTRLRVDQSLSFSIPPIFNDIGTLTQTTYYYYDNNANNLAFRYNNLNLVSAFLGIDQTTETLERNTAFTLSNNIFETSSFNVYPNPVKDIISIRLGNNEKIATLSILDIQGRTVFTTTKNTEYVSIGNLNKGMYLLTLQTEAGKSFTKKIIKQ